GANTGAPATWAFTRDLGGRTVESIDPLARRTRQRFDERGLLLERTQAAGHTEAARWTAGYDVNGRKVSATDAADHSFSFEWDAWGRMAQVGLPGEPGTVTTVRMHYAPRDLVART